VTVSVIKNPLKNAALAFVQEATDFLESKGVTVLEEPAPEADFWLVLGGDGTMLRSSHEAAVFNVPMLGINFGTLGFLTDTDKEKGLDALEKLINGHYTQEKRLMLEIDGHLPQTERLALNDVYFSRGGFEKLIQLDLYINEQFMDSLRGDGVLVSTPTGSTAYNLSAGGPILVPDGDMMVITPVCPHHYFNARPWVITARDTLSVLPHQQASVTLDGETCIALSAGEKMTVRKSDFTATIIKTSDLHFYEILRRKMYH
jgi:NAD+ kinase